jgi:hypothetical protein
MNACNVGTKVNFAVDGAHSVPPETEIVTSTSMTPAWSPSADGVIHATAEVLSHLAGAA